ncbi:mitochondrial import inner membrane translocase subunit Tim29 isoform X2 [Engraulis encrasicolus]|uniref:mitochondrial import inner membrane translocase subunit Tim29 isoform X2 n=1 Tax=Engraulis encrasicolus TaxID=184585 RepID=UPI002FD0F0B0
MAASLVLRRWCSAAAAEAAAPKKGTRWERLKNGRVGVWIKGMYGDYKEACREIVVGARDRPIKAGVYLGLLGGAYACFITNPGEGSFDAEVMDVSNQLALLSPWIRNGVSDGHVQKMAKLRSQGRLRYLSLGLVSLEYQAEYDPDANLYEAVCSPLSVPWRELHERVVDVGFAGRWWVLDNKMKDYDVNEEEFRNLPPALQASVPPAPQATERNEQLHKDSWKPVGMQEDEEERARAAAEAGQQSAGGGEGAGTLATILDSAPLRDLMSSLQSINPLPLLKDYVGGDFMSSLQSINPLPVLKKYVGGVAETLKGSDGAEVATVKGSDATIDGGEVGTVEGSDAVVDGGKGETVEGSDGGVEGSDAVDGGKGETVEGSDGAEVRTVKGSDAAVAGGEVETVEGSDGGEVGTVEGSDAVDGGEVGTVEGSDAVVVDGGEGQTVEGSAAVDGGEVGTVEGSDGGEGKTVEGSDATVGQSQQQMQT